MRGSSPSMTTFLFLQEPGEEAKAARPGEIGACLVVASALVAMETVLRARIHMDLDLGAFGSDDLDIGERDAGVLFAEMQLRRHFRLVVGKTRDGAAVVADRRREPRQFCRSRIG